MTECCENLTYEEKQESRKRIMERLIEANREVRELNERYRESQDLNEVKLEEAKRLLQKVEALRMDSREKPQSEDPTRRL